MWSIGFSICPPFRPAISVRIERRDSIRMTVSQTEGWGGLRSERPRMDANRSVAIAGLGLIGAGARGGPLPSDVFGGPGRVPQI
jgi:hypothetical protein